MKKRIIQGMLSVMVVAATAATLQGCAPEVGSKEWCADLKEKPKGEWTVNEGKSFAEHCLFK